MRNKSERMIWVKHRGSQTLGYITRYVVLTALVFVIAYPILMKLSILFMDYHDFSDSTVRFFPKTLTFDNITKAFVRLDYPIALLKTLLYVTTLSGVQVFFAMLTAYGLASFQFPGSKVLFLMVLLTLIIPPQAILLPLYLNFNNLSMLGTVWPIYLLSIGGMALKNGLLIFIFRQFFKSLPHETEESAYIDGAGVVRTFFSVVMPSAVPMILTCFLFSFVWQYTDSFYTAIFSPQTEFLPQALDKLYAELNPDLAKSLVNNAAELLVILPILLLYIFSQRHFVESIERTGLVG
jgi:multiple sugar transport system permease protein